MDDDTANAQDARVHALWSTLDTGRAGHLDLDGLKKGLGKLDHPLRNADALLGDVMKAIDANHDGQITFNEFSAFVKETESQLYALFKSIDRDHNGKLDKAELQSAFLQAGLLVPQSKLNKFFADVDTNRDGVITFDEWRDFLLFIPESAPDLSQVLSYFSSTVKLSPEGDVIISDETIHGLGTAQRFFHLLISILFGAIIGIVNPSFSSSHSTTERAGISAVSVDGSEQSQASSRAAEFSMQSVNSSASVPLPPEELPPAVVPPATTAWSQWEKLKPELIACFPAPGYYLAGALAGVASRTTTAPLDRLKVYLIAQTGVARSVEAAKSGAPLKAVKHAWTPLVEASKDLWRAGGMRSLFAGNGLNVLKVMPESAVKFGAFEASKRVLSRLEGHGDPRKISSANKFVAGGIGGIISQFVVYPLDTLKFRMQCETVSGGPHGNRLIIDTAKKMWRTGGVRSFYIGLPMGLIGIFPYSAIDLGTFEYTKRALTIRNARKRGVQEEQGELGNVTTAMLGGFSGALGASIVYPINLLRTRLQSQGTAAHQRTYSGIGDVLRQTLKGEGVSGLFKGLTPNLLKVVPAVSITYVVYENTKKAMALQ